MTIHEYTKQILAIANECARRKITPACARNQLRVLANLLDWEYGESSSGDVPSDIVVNADDRLVSPFDAKINLTPDSLDKLDAAAKYLGKDNIPLTKQRTLNYALKCGLEQLADLQADLESGAEYDEMR